jgi:HSP20 family protein
MAITLWKTRTPFEGLIRWFEDDTFTAEFVREWRPCFDIAEKEGTYVVKADLPGVKKEDIHIELENDTLTLRGERKAAREETKGTWHRVERTFGSFERRFRLPEGVSENDIHAKYTDGVLELTIPAPKPKEPKAIEVKVE